MGETASSYSRENLTEGNDNERANDYTTIPEGISVKVSDCKAVLGKF